MSYLVEKGIPVPAATPNSRYPFAAMEVGDSFFAAKGRATVTGATRRNSKATGRLYRVAEETKDGIAGVRVWRIG